MIKCQYCDEINCICDPLDKLVAWRKNNWSKEQIKECYEGNLKEIDKMRVEQ